MEIVKKRRIVSPSIVEKRIGKTIFSFFLLLFPVVLMPPSSLSFHSFFFLFGIFFFLWLLVVIRRPCFSIYPFSSFSYSNVYTYSNRHRPLRSLLFFSLFYVLCKARTKREREKKITTTIPTNINRTM